MREPEEGGMRGKAALGAKLQQKEDRLKGTRGVWTAKENADTEERAFRPDRCGALKESPTPGTS